MNKKIISLIICMVLFLFIVLTIPANLTEKVTLNENIISKDTPELFETFVIFGGESKTLNFTSRIKKLSINITIQPNRIIEFCCVSLKKYQLVPNEILDKFGTWNLYIYELDNLKQENGSYHKSVKYEYEGINGNFNTTIKLKWDTNYQLKIENIGIMPLPVSMEFLAVVSPSSDIPLTYLSFILPIGIIILTLISLWFMYKFRFIVYLEKRDNNRILEKLIKTNKVDPNKVLKVLREMNKSSNKEGLKLTSSLSSITNKIVDKLKSDQEDKNDIDKEELIHLLKKSKVI